MPGNGKNGGFSLEHPLTMKYACRKSGRREAAAAARVP